MNKSILFAPLAFAFILGGCADTSSYGDEVSRTAGSAMAFQSANADAALMMEQTQTLDQMMQKIVRNTTIKHAAVGAAVGCGLAVVSASSASNCLTAAAAGGVAGAISGHVAGKRDVTRRMELVSANALVRSIRASNDQLSDITTDLPNFLAAQDAKVKNLVAQKNSGALDEAEFDARMASIRASRSELAETLLMSSQKARIASANLREAAAQGQTGLEWHIGAVDQMEDQTMSARSQISLL